MADLSGFKRGQIFGVRMVSASVNKTVQMFVISRIVMITFEKEKKTSQQSTSQRERERLSNLTSNC